MRYTLYYRGAISSCNYACPYCPFSKTRDSAEVFAKDKAQLLRFVTWLHEQRDSGYEYTVFFNPYGEALIHRWYREAMVALSHLPHIRKVAIQTNLSAKLDWTRELNKRKAAFWATYHPGETTESAFLTQCNQLERQEISFSVGTVGVKKHFPAIQSLRQALSPNVYLWINAYKDQPNYYSPVDIDFLRRIDPLFVDNLVDYVSKGKRCKAGEQVFYVHGTGKIKRCYKDRRVLGDLYRDGLAALSAERPCALQTCDCYIGYIHMPDLALDQHYGEHLLERIAFQG